MRTLAQIRAANALKDTQGLKKDLGKGKNGGTVLSGFPTTIKNCGLIAAVAFAVEVKKEKDKPETYKNLGQKLIVDGIAKHLSSDGINICDAKTATDLLDELAHGDVETLTRATAEAIAYLNYLKRFVA